MKRYIFLLLVVAACNKDRITQESVIYMPQAVDYPAVRNTVMTDSMQTIIVGAAFGGTDDVNRNIQVQLNVNTALVDSFNKKNGTGYPVMPAGSYTLEKNETLINTPVKLSIKTVGSLEASKEYLLPVSIESPVKINEKLRTTYFLIKAEFKEYERAQWMLMERAQKNRLTSPSIPWIITSPRNGIHNGRMPNRRTRII